MDFNQLLSFVTVAQTLNFTSAARRNGVPQSTVSRQIDSLEEQIGTQLFYRTRRQVHLTDEGKIFLPYAKEILTQMEKGEETVRRFHEGGEGRLSVSAVSASGPFLTNCLKDFAGQYPNIVVDLSEASAGNGLPVANTDSNDFHFLLQEMAEGHEEYDLLVTHSLDLVLVVPKGHQMVREGLKSEDLRAENFIFVSEKDDPILYMQAMNLCQSMRFTPHVVNCFDSAEMVMVSVAAGLGISILPGGIPGLEERGLTAMPFPGGTGNMTYVAAWKKSLLNPTAKLFLEVLRRQSGA